jgi:hypothetical protein
MTTKYIASMGHELLSILTTMSTTTTITRVPFESITVNITAVVDIVPVLLNSGGSLDIGKIELLDNTHIRILFFIILIIYLVGQLSEFGMPFNHIAVMRTNCNSCEKVV